MDQLRPEILRDLHEKNVENTIKAVMDNVHTNLNLDFFTPVPRRQDSAYPRDDASSTGTAPEGWTAHTAAARRPTAKP